MLISISLLVIAFAILLVYTELKKHNELKKEELSLLKEQTESLGFISQTLFEASTMQISEVRDIASALKAIDHTQKLKMKTSLRN
jgi:hypothetical protein